MDQQEIQQLFREFAAPLSSFVSLGSDKQAAEELARNLWMAMIGGKAAEAQLWQALEEADSELFLLLKQCYQERMKPLVGPQQLAALRNRYGISEGEET